MPNDTSGSAKRAPRKRARSASTDDALAAADALARAVPTLAPGAAIAPDTSTPFPDSWRSPDVLANAIRSHIERYISLPSDAEYDVVTLWAFHTYVFASASHTPYLNVPADYGSGKSTLIDVLSGLVHRPMVFNNPTSSTIVTAAHFGHTLFIDEVSSLFVTNTRAGARVRAMISDIESVLCAGFKRKNSEVPRGRPGGNGWDMYVSFAPKLLAGTQALPDMLMSRCIPIRIRKVSAGERREPFLDGIAGPDASAMAAALDDWSTRAGDKLHNVLPADYKSLPDTITDGRTVDIWVPLLNIADMIGDDWPARARAAMISLGGDVAPAITGADYLDVMLRGAFRSGYVAAETFVRVNGYGDRAPIPSGLGTSVAISNSDLGYDVDKQRRVSRSFGCSLYINEGKAEIRVRKSEWHIFYAQVEAYAMRSDLNAPSVWDFVSTLRDAHKGGLHARTDSPSARSVRAKAFQDEEYGPTIALDVSHWLWPNVNRKDA